MVKNGLIWVEIITKIDGIQVIFTILNGKEIWRQDNYLQRVFLIWYTLNFAVVDYA